jgi:hypothetical protein
MVLNRNYQSNQTISPKTPGGVVIAVKNGPSQRMRGPMIVPKRLQRKCITAIAEKCRNDSSTDIVPSHFQKGIEFDRRAQTAKMSNGSELVTMRMASDLRRQVMAIDDTFSAMKFFAPPCALSTEPTAQPSVSYERRVVEPGCWVISFRGNHFVFIQVSARLHQSND